MYNIKNITSREVFRGFRAQTIHHSIFCHPEAGYAGYIPEERTLFKLLPCTIIITVITATFNATQKCFFFLSIEGLA